MRVSVVICTHNRAEALTRAIRSLEDLEVPTEVDWELVVVDNASSDGTREAVADLGARSELPLRYVHEAEPGLSVARNAGIEAADGEVVAFLDDDVRVHPDWLAEVVRAFRRHPDVDCVGGRVVLAAEVERPPWWRPEYEGKAGEFDRGDEPRRLSGEADGMIGIGANLSFRRAVFDRVGLFRSDLGRKEGRLLMGEELDLIGRMWRAGGVGMYWPFAVVDHYPSAARFEKTYLRRWYLSHGEWAYQRERERGGPEVRIGGVPRWKYREALESLGRCVLAAGRGDRGRAFFEQLRFLSSVGYLRAAFRDARR